MTPDENRPDRPAHPHLFQSVANVCDKTERKETGKRGVKRSHQGVAPGGDSCDRGYLMIESFELANFRCFEKLSLSDLSRVNVVTGSNASGKSALLEALYLGTNGTAQAVQNIAASRALLPAAASTPMGPFPFLISTQSAPTLGLYFDHLFRSIQKDGKFEISKLITISYKDNKNLLYSLGVHYQTDGDTPVPVSLGVAGAVPSPPIIFDRGKASPKIRQTTPIPITINQFGQLQQPPVAPLGPVTFIFGANLAYAEVDNVTWFSQLKERNESDQIIEFIRNEFPFIKDIEILAPVPGANGLYATMTDGTRRRLTTVSAGIYKIISILLSCAHTHEGIIVIDEIENGIFYEKYPAVWRILYNFAKETKNQLFISSHSDECLRAILPIMEENIQDFSLLRTERENGTCAVHHISGAAMRAALRRDDDLRGGSANGGAGEGETLG
jgi:hypothetical protein